MTGQGGLMTTTSATVDLAEAVRAGLAHCPATVYVVTASAADGTPVGATATSVTSVSLAPPQVLVCLSSASTTLGGVLTSGRLALHALAAGQESIAEAFAAPNGAKFRSTPWTWSPAATPLLPDALFRLDCRVSQAVTVSDHVVIVAEVIAVEPCRDGEALVRVHHRFS